MNENLQELVGNVKVGTSAFKRESDGVDGGVGKRVKSDGDSGGNCKGVDFQPSLLLSPWVSPPLFPRSHILFASLYGSHFVRNGPRSS